MRGLLTLLALVLAAAPAGAGERPPCGFGFEVDTQTSAFQSLMVDGEEKAGFWLSIDRAPAEVRQVARFVGRLQVCLGTPGDVPATVARNGGSLELRSPFVANCTATLLPGNRLLTNWHCLHDPSLAAAGFTEVREVRVNFGYTARDDTGDVRTFAVSPRPADGDPELDALVLQIVGADANAAQGGHFPMRMLATPDSLQELRMIHHPGAGPQQYSTGTCQVHRRQAEIDPGRSPFRHTCESMAGSSGALILDARTLAVVALHNQGGLRPGGDSFNGGHKIAIVEAALGLGFTAAIEAPDEDVPPVELRAARALADALLLPDLADRVAAVRAVAGAFPGSDAAAQAGAALAVLERRLEDRAAEAAPAPPPAAPPAPVDDTASVCTGLLDRALQGGGCGALQTFAADCPAHPMHGLIVSRLPTACAAAAAPPDTPPSEMAACDQLAGSQDHPELRAAHVAGTALDRIDGAAAVAACTAALRATPDHPRLLTNLARAHTRMEDHARAFELNSRAAALGDPLAMTNLGRYLETGLAGMRDEDRAAALFRTAAEQGLAVAQFNLAALYARGAGVSASVPEALRWYERAALAGFVPAQRTLGLIHEEGRGVHAAPARAQAWYRRAAEAGDAQAQYDLARLLEAGLGSPPKPAAAVDWYARAADQGHPDAALRLGLMHLDGRVTPGSDAEAVRLLSVAAEAGDAEARYRLGLLSEEGRGTAASPTHARGWYEAAAAQGHVDALLRLAELQAAGLGGPRSQADAFRSYLRAAEAGHPHAQTVVGLRYLRGQGTEMSHSLALRWFRAAALQQDPRGLYNYAVMLDAGLGAPRDADTALHYFRAAADRGDPLAPRRVAGFFETGEVVARDPDRAAMLYLQSLQAGDRFALDRAADDWPPDTLRALQRRLLALGHYHGPQDGRPSAGLHAAMARLLP